MSERALSVSDVTALVHDALSRRPELEDVLVEGEMSNLKMPASGHLYFTLKDGHSSLSCVCFRSSAQRVPFRPENGMTLIAHGSVQVYGQQGVYQLVVDRLEPSGVGALALAVEQLKRRLAAEGLFDERLKRPLPVLPRRVVVVTSRSGAALRDVFTVMTRRAPGVDLVLSPATVQGEGAADTIITALRRAEAVRGASVILLVRGGGSIEDLMPFNSETLARAIRAARIPVVTGIGHETDTTVADLAADRRAATPSAAAETAVPSVAELRREVGARSLRLSREVQRRVVRDRTSLERTTARLQRLSPAQRIAGLRQELDRRSALLRHALLREVASKRRGLDAGGGRLAGQRPEHRIAAARARLVRSGDRMATAEQRVVERARAGLERRGARLESLSPLRTLERGYSITLDAEGRVLTDTDRLDRGASLRTLLRRGAVASTVEEVEKADQRGERMYDTDRNAP